MPERPADDSSDVAWLEHYPEQGSVAERVALRMTPFALGRGAESHHILSSAGVSREHAVIVRDGDKYSIRDLGSTNGTFVNGERARTASLADGDIIHLAHAEFCFRRPAHHPAEGDGYATVPLPASAHDSHIRESRLVQELIAREAVTTVFQPIVTLRSREIIGYEALGRGTHPALTDRPALLLQMAERARTAAPLSQLFRRRAIADAAALPSGTTVFLNVHSSELGADDFIGSLSPRASEPPGAQQFVLEIAEASVTDVPMMVRMRKALRTRGYGFAYDDFGAGQARVVELSDAPPDYLKLDRALVQGLVESMPRRQLVRALVKVMSDLGVRVIAEGIETPDVAATCEALGCPLGQGYLFGRPAPVGAGLKA